MASTNTYSLVGRKTVYIGSETIDSEFLAAEAATITVTPSSTEFDSQLGTYSIPNGSFEELSVTLTLLIPNIRFLGKIFPGLWVEGYEDEDTGETMGQVRFGATECRTVDPVPVVIHNTCADGSEDDIQIPQALIAQGGEFTVSRDDPFELEVTITPMPGTEGAIIMGVGDLEGKSLYNPETQEYEQVES